MWYAAVSCPTRADNIPKRRNKNIKLGPPHSNIAQKQYVDVSFMELAAFDAWCRVQHFSTHEQFMSEWDRLCLDEQSEWLPVDHIGSLATGYWRHMLSSRLPP